MDSQLIILCFTAASIGIFHTLLGPDHYLPFVVLSKARRWSRTKTVWITLACGIGHVGSSILIGAIGIATGVALSKLEFIESFRGDLAAWFFIIFGSVYALWGIRKAFKRRSGIEVETQIGNPKSDKTSYRSLSPWILFVIFVFGPCEPLIPLLMFPAIQHSISGVVIITAVFGISTIVTMSFVVWSLTTGFQRLKTDRLERYSHVLAGAVILCCGLAIRFMGL